MVNNVLNTCRIWSKALVVAAAILPAPIPVRAADAYVVRFRTTTGQDCQVVGYRDHLTFHNTTGQDLTVRALGGSNGYQPPSDPLVVPAGKTRAVTIVPFGLGGLTNQWAPVAPSVFVVNRLDVPDGLIVESRGEVYGIGLRVPCTPFSIGTEIFGEFSLPVVRILAAANVPEFHMASEFGTLDSRTNVGVYNGGTANATAKVEVRAACDDRVLDSRTGTIPAASVVYVTGFEGTFLGTTCLGGGGASDYARYVVVTLDQPGFSFVFTRADVMPVGLPVTSSVAR